MSPRRSIYAAILLVLVVTPTLTTSHARAQTAYPGYGPVVVNNNISGADPYAMGTTQAGGWLPPNPFPSGNMIGGYVPGPMAIADRLWIRADYLHWWTEGMDVPALVTTSPDGTARTSAGILGQPGTRTLFGGGEINNDSTSGVRFRTGFWLNAQGAFAIESEFFQLLGSQDDGFQASGDGSPIIARPFFDASRGIDTAQLISYPNLVSGNVRVGSESDLKSFLINARAGLCPIGICNPDGESDRVDWIIGYRYLKLEDQIGISENITSEITSSPGTIAINESFRTSNEFNGLQLGVIHQANFRRAWLESMLRVAVGSNNQRVDINGTTTRTENGTTDQFTGGLLAQRSNIGRYERDEFTMVPEVGFTLGVRLTDWLDATVGYSMLYFPSVVRAGSQIDTDIDSNLLPPEADPLVSDGRRPEFKFIESDYWAHGLNLGAELRF
ncbi:hypothetical protein K227x_59740 [Rubripirellula lacrimiformis]|uniref:BBP7 family outer membrane beta-barrel protein n=1 Tax=Rubripirellula lacrimiformis TaxID=1930273 RepID=A0A517NK99_9BACT|nr:BBP7 family outer membrane beta-barrel protein [Rubripirellula lacrimiformis]QDT07546.1 hypothetical protein K227x_59740 [Rubripirellula lacrimiformis]